MSERSIQRIAEQLEQQLAQLGQLREANEQRIAAVEQQQQMLQQQFNSQGALACNVVQLRNRQQLHQLLLPSLEKNAQKLELLAQEKQRLERLWGNILRRRQGLKWLSNQRKERAKQAQRKAEQRQQDEFASRRRLSQ